MSKSFSIDLNRYSLGRTIGGSKKLLERKLDVSDLISVLMDEGFSEFNETRVYHQLHGHDMAGFRSLITSGVLGVPRHAFVTITAFGKDNQQLVVEFDY